MARRRSRGVVGPALSAELERLGVAPEPGRGDVVASWGFCGPVCFAFTRCGGVGGGKDAKKFAGRFAFGARFRTRYSQSVDVERASTGETRDPQKSSKVGRTVPPAVWPCRCGDGEWFWTSGSWPAGRGRRIRGSPDRVIVWPCVRAGRVPRLGWWVGLPLLGALEWDSRAFVQLSMDTTHRGLNSRECADT